MHRKIRASIVAPTSRYVLLLSSSDFSTMSWNDMQIFLPSRTAACWLSSTVTSFWRWHLYSYFPAARFQHISSAVLLRRTNLVHTDACSCEMVKIPWHCVTLYDEIHDVLVVCSTAVWILILKAFSDVHSITWSIVFTMSSGLIRVNWRTWVMMMVSLRMKRSKLRSNSVMMCIMLSWNIHRNTWWDDRRKKVRLKHSSDAGLRIRSWGADGQHRMSEDHMRHR